MGQLDQAEAMNGGLQTNFDIQPRVFVRKMGGEYTEITGIKSYEKSDDGTGGKITLVMAEGQTSAVNSILLSKADKYVEVKMEFMIGMLMVMKFSGFVADCSDNTVCFSVSTPFTTDVLDIAQ